MKCLFLILPFSLLTFFLSFPVSCFVIIRVLLIIYDVFCCCFSNSSLSTAFISSTIVSLSNEVFLFVFFWNFIATEAMLLLKFLFFFFENRVRHYHLRESIIQVPSEKILNKTITKFYNGD